VYSPGIQEQQIAGFRCEYVFIRVTIDFPDPLFRELKAEAGRRGESLENVIRNAVEIEIRKEQSKAVRRVSFPLLPSREPGTLNLTNADTEDLLA